MTEDEMKALKPGDRIHTPITQSSTSTRVNAELKNGKVVSPWPNLRIRLEGESEDRAISEGQHLHLHVSR